MMHRKTAVAGAALILFSQMLQVIGLLPDIIFTPFDVVAIGIHALTMVTIAVMLLRGRRDTAAGIVLLLAIIIPLLSAMFGTLAVLMLGELFYAVLFLLSGFTEAVFMGSAAKECISEGNISVGKGRVILWLLPVLCLCCELGKTGVYGWFDLRNPETYFWSYGILRWVGMILAGVSLSVPEKIEKNPM